MLDLQIYKIVAENTSTHYANQSHYTEFKSKPQLTLYDQHGKFK